MSFKNKKVVIIDYGMGNLGSLLNVLKYVGVKTEITDDPSIISKSPILILPGVGSFKKAMQKIRKKNIDEAINLANKNGKCLLGICLGMQLMGSSSDEDGKTRGLCLMNNKVEKFKKKETKNKIPHVGFNDVIFDSTNKLFKNLKNNRDFYFVHSYRMMKEKLSKDITLTNYGVDFLSSFQKDNLFATQFHPEKSQENGIRVIENFLKLT